MPGGFASRSGGLASPRVFRRSAPLERGADEEKTGLPARRTKATRAAKRWLFSPVFRCLGATRASAGGLPRKRAIPRCIAARFLAISARFPVGVKRPQSGHPRRSWRRRERSFRQPIIQIEGEATMNTLWMIVGCGVLADPLWHLGDRLGAGRRCRQPENAGNFRRRARRRAGLSQAPIHHHRHRRRRHLRHHRLDARLAGRRRLRRRRDPLRRHRLHRHERLGARQCARRAGRDQVARRRPRARLQVGRHHRHAGRRPRAARRHALFRLPHRHAAQGAQRPHRHRRHRRARLRRLADLDLRPSRRRHLHQGRRRRRRSGRQGGSRHSGRRSAQSGDHRRQRGRQCRRLRRHGRRPVRDLCGDHRRHHGAGLDLLCRDAAAATT